MTQPFAPGKIGDRDVDDATDDNDDDDENTAHNL